MTVCPPTIPGGTLEAQTLNIVSLGAKFAAKPSKKYGNTNTQIHKYINASNKTIVFHHSFLNCYSNDSIMTKK